MTQPQAIFKDGDERIVEYVPVHVHRTCSEWRLTFIILGLLARRLLAPFVWVLLLVSHGQDNKTQAFARPSDLSRIHIIENIIDMK
jgi:hypothetical protein